MLLQKISEVKNISMWVIYACSTYWNYIVTLITSTERFEIESRQN